MLSEEQMKQKICNSALFVGLLIGLNLLAGCASVPQTSAKPSFDYSADMLDCIADELDRGAVGPCITAALADHETQIK